MRYQHLHNALIHRNFAVHHSLQSGKLGTQDWDASLANKVEKSKLRKQRSHHDAVVAQLHHHQPLTPCKSNYNF
jgi:hypothetical protein